MRPLHIAAEDLREVAGGQIDVYGGDDHRREWMQDEAGQRKYEPEEHGAVIFHLEEPNNSTLSNGLADQGRKRLSVNFVGCPGFTSTST
jgi:hypothetical protein